MSRTLPSPSPAQQTTAALLAGLTTLTMLWGIVGLADSYHAQSAQMARSQSVPGLIQPQAQAVSPPQQKS